MYNQHTFISSQLIKMVSLVSGEGCLFPSGFLADVPKEGDVMSSWEKGQKSKKS